MQKKKILRAGFEPATYGYLHHYSPPLYQLSYRRMSDFASVHRSLNPYQITSLVKVLPTANLASSPG